MAETQNPADPLKWEQALQLKNSLFEDSRFVSSAYVALAIYTGRRYSDLCKFTWASILDEDLWQVIEKKTKKKTRQYVIQPALKSHIDKCFNASPKDRNASILAGRSGAAMTIQYINKELKRWNAKYQLGITNISTHSLRKTFGRRIVQEYDNPNDGFAAVMHLLNHSNFAETKLYLGVMDDEINDVLLRM